jgi:hypothetical protein
MEKIDIGDILILNNVSKTLKARWNYVILFSWFSLYKYGYPLGEYITMKLVCTPLKRGHFYSSRSNCNTPYKLDKEGWHIVKEDWVQLNTCAVKIPSYRTDGIYE